MAKSEVAVMIKLLHELAEQGALSDAARAVACDAASFIEAVTSAVFDTPGRDPSTVVDRIKAIYALHQFG